MDFAKEEVQVTLIDGTETKVWLRKYINLPQKQELLRKHTDKLRIRGNEGGEWIVDFTGLLKSTIEMIYVKEDNPGITIDDIVPQTIEPHVAEMVKGFLLMGMGVQTLKSTV